MGIVVNSFRESGKAKVLFSIDEVQFRQWFCILSDREAQDIIIKILQEKGWGISFKNIKSGLLKVVENTGLLGRWQILGDNPKIICDTAHNKEGLQYTLKQLADEKFKQLHIVLGVVDDKNLNDILPLFPKDAIYYFCKAQVPRALDTTTLLNKAAEYQLTGKSYPSVKEAFKASKKNAKVSDLIYIGGSTFVVAELV